MEKKVLKQIAMEFINEQQSQIDKIIGSMDCHKDFKCSKSGFDDLCKIKIFNDGELIECLETSAWLCKLSFGFGRGYFCRCPLRKYIAKNFHK